MSKSITDTRKKDGRGRPRVDAVQIGVRVPPAELAEIDAWREKQPDVPTRPEALRRLAAKGLKGE